MYISAIFFFNDTATTEIYTLSLHDALPIYNVSERFSRGPELAVVSTLKPLSFQRRNYSSKSRHQPFRIDRKSTRLNSSHGYISYAVFCLKKKKNKPLICYA